jgi:DNA-binding PadR family transcriptional regulator
MGERELLVLGLLKTQSQHGYQLNDFIERNLGRVSDMKKSTAYLLLKKLNQSGYVDVSVEQDGNRPPKQVYSITPAGEAKFLELLREALNQVDDVTPSGDIGLMYIDYLPRDEALRFLQERVEKVEALLAVYENAPKHGFGVGVDLSIRHRVVLLTTERDWLKQCVEQLPLW